MVYFPLKHLCLNNNEVYFVEVELLGESGREFKTDLPQRLNNSGKEHITSSKLDIHSAHAGSPCKQFHDQNILLFFSRPVLASPNKTFGNRMCLVDQLPCGSVLTPAISCTKFKIHSAHVDSPMAETFNNFFLQVCLGRTSLCFTDQETQEENVLSGPTPFWFSSYTSYLLYKVQDPFSACRQSYDENN